MRIGRTARHRDRPYRATLALLGKTLHGKSHFRMGEKGYSMAPLDHFRNFAEFAQA